MKVKEVKYERNAMVGRFESARVGITVQLDDDETAEMGIDVARMFVERNLRLAGATIVSDLQEE